MPKDDFYTPTDIDALRMENELLTFEVRFLKTQLAETERLKAETERLKSRLEESERSKAEFSSGLEESERSVAELKSRPEESERAEKDLALLLRRLGTSPLGPLFRARPSFRTLERRYLDTDA